MDKGGDIWSTLILPAVAEENDPLGRKAGEFLWDNDVSYGYGDFLRRELATQPPSNWASLYQQRPAPEEGDYFLREWLKPYVKAPPIETLKCYAGSDYAVTSKGGDYTVHLVVGVDPDWKIYLLDVWRQQAPPDVWVEAMLDLANKWKPICWAEETGQIRASLDPFIQRRMQERKIPLFRRQFPTRYDKSIRAQAIRGQMAMGGLYVPTRASWYPAFLQELLSFPRGKHDDQVDALGLIGQLLIVPGRKPVKTEARWDPRQDAYRVITSDRELESYAMGGSSALNWQGDEEGSYVSIKTL
jgi:predicted phage terminase large subunit-like protein